MTLKPQDRRALSFLGVALLLSAIYAYWPDSLGEPGADASPDAISLAEQRLDRLRANAATVEAKDEILKQVRAQLEEREKGLLRSETGAQAQAELIQILRKLGSQEQPVLEIRATQLGAVSKLDDNYGIANVTVQLTCPISQLVNFLAALAAQPQLIVTRNLSITSPNSKDKLVQARLTVGAVVPKELVPKEKGAGL